MKRLRTAVIGLGRIGWQYHAPQVAAHEGFELVAVVDPLPERRQEAGARFGAHAYADVEAMWAAETLDLLVIASPTLFHADQAIEAFARGCDVFCDKPLAPTLAEAERMIAAQQAHGRKLMVYQPHRARPEVVVLQRLLANGLIGPLFMIKRAAVNYQRRNDWQAFRRYGGGILNNAGAHYIDQLLYLAGSPARRVSCALRRVVTLGDAEDTVKAVIETESGVLLDLDISTAVACPMPEWYVLGARGCVTLDHEAHAWTVRYYREEDLGAGTVYQGLAAPDRRYGNQETIPWLVEQVPFSAADEIDFYQKCYAYYALDEAPFVPIEQTHQVMRLLDLCHQEVGFQPLSGSA